ncbi:hypothetical protein BBJ28_00015770 [Nothophytophthora sp. Chile5]|nr:hypothetical protein BBJ28_00015770 [Nothophytophthora sp. Chile5]
MSRQPDKSAPYEGEGVPYYSVDMNPSLEPVVVSQTGQIPVHVPQENSGIAVGRWDIGFCDCFTHCVPNCCMVTFCPCISMAQIASKLNITSYACALITILLLMIAECVTFGLAMNEFAEQYRTRDGYYDYYYDYYYGYHYYDYYDETSTSVAFRIISAVVRIIFAVFVWQLRSKTRERFQIPGGCICDCCAALFCSCCTLAQVATHVKSYTPGSCDFGPPVDTLPAYR